VSADSPLSRVLARVTTLDAVSLDDTIIPTGFPSLDRALRGGFRRGDLMVLGGDDGAGASSLALGIALRCTPRALFITGETREERVYERALAICAKVELESLQLGVLSAEERARVEMIAPSLPEWAPAVDTLTHGGSDMLWTAHDRVPTAPLLIVDGIEALLARDFETSDALAGILLELKRFALERNVAVLALSHLPALDRTRPDKRPRLADFGARGAAGVHADVVFGLFREEIYDGDVAVTGAAELALLKHRDGALGYVDLYFTAKWLRFQDVLDPDG
jgi:replicative DNA helicase